MNPTGILKENPVLAVYIAAALGIMFGLYVVHCGGNRDAAFTHWSTPERYRYAGECIQFRTNLTTGLVEARTIP